MGGGRACWGEVLEGGIVLVFGGGGGCRGGGEEEVVLGGGGKMGSALGDWGVGSFCWWVDGLC